MSPEKVSSEIIEAQVEDLRKSIAESSKPLTRQLGKCALVIYMSPSVFKNLTKSLKTRNVKVIDKAITDAKQELDRMESSCLIDFSDVKAYLFQAKTSLDERSFDNLEEDIESTIFGLLRVLMESAGESK